VLLHVIEGRLAELEVFRADGKPIIQMPPAENFQFVEQPLLGSMGKGDA
jgi:hypothetical protein